jgi:hypothetical protein
MDMINHASDSGGYVELDDKNAAHALGTRRRKKNTPSKIEFVDTTKEVNYPLKSMFDDRWTDTLIRPDIKTAIPAVKKIQRKSNDFPVPDDENLTTLRRYNNSTKHYANDNQTPGTFVVYRTTPSQTGEVLVNYNADGFSTLDWFLHFGFIPFSHQKEYVMTQNTLSHSEVHPLNLDKNKGFDGDTYIPTRDDLEAENGVRFEIQEEMSKKWRRERGLDEDAEIE